MRYLLLILLLVVLPGSAEIYRWVDERGKVHFGDRAPEDKSAERVQLEINSYTHVSYELQPDLERTGDSREVVMYSTNWCGYCKKARAFFKREGIAFKEYDIEKSASARRAYDRLGGRGVPVILVGKLRMNGFSESGFRRLMADAQPSSR